MPHWLRLALAIVAGSADAKPVLLLLRFAHWLPCGLVIAISGLNYLNPGIRHCEICNPAINNIA